MKRFFGFLMVGFFLFTSAFLYAQPPGKCGNGNSKGTSTPPDKKLPKAGDPINVYTGNEHRVVNDLEIWGAVGDIPFIWKRYYNSREYAGFTYSFHYTMTSAGNNNLGQAQVRISFPDGMEIIFAQSPTDPSRWLPPSGVEERLFQDGTNFFLQNSQGHRYRFKKIINPEGSFYQLLDFRDASQNLYTLTYSGDALSRITEPGGRYFEISYIFISNAFINKVIDKVTTSDGRSVKYNYTIFTETVFHWERMTSVDYGDGTHATYKYHSQYNAQLHIFFGFLYLEHAIDPRYAGVNVNMRFTYDSLVARGYIKEEINGKTGHLMATLTTAADNRWVCNANGQVQHYKMPDDQLGITTEYTDGLGRTTKYGYDASGFIAQETDALNRTTTYINTPFNNPLEITHPDGTKEKWTRDDLDLILTYTDELNRVTTYTRDNLHRVTKISYPDGTEERYTYNNFGQALTHTLRNGGIETNVYNNRSLKLSFTDVLGHTSFYTYDVADRLASVTDARGNVTRYEYNERGLLTKKINADNSFQLYAYDDYGNRTNTTNELGQSWKKVFDEFKRIIRSTDPLNRETVYSYDLPGGICGCTHANEDPTRIVLPSGKAIRIEYDMEWQMTKKISGAGSPDAATILYEYDAAGNLLSVIDAKMQHWSYEYDLRDRSISLNDPLGHKTLWTHDATGNLLTEKRPDNGLTVYEYDNMDRLVKVVNPKGEITTFTYDNGDNLIRLTDPRNQQYDFEFDLLNRGNKRIYPGGSFESYVYDATGNLQSYTNRSGNIRTYSYDNRNREVQSNWSDSTPAISRTYDAAGRMLTQITDVSALSYTYNSANELTSETQNITGAAGIKQISYTYNADGLRNNIAYPGAATTITYDYTARNQVASINENGVALVSYGYDLNGNRVAQFRNNQTGTSYGYDNANRQLSITHQKSGLSLAHLGYGYDNTDRITFVKRDYAKGDVYAYDAIDQVTGVQYEVSNPDGVPIAPARTVSYSYDVVGNRNQINDNGTLTDYTSNNLNQYTLIGGNALTYSNNGNLQTYNGWTYTYDARDRLIRATKGNDTMSFSYDARNRCVKRTMNGNAVFLYYDRWNLIQEYDSGDALLKQYVYGTRTDELLTMSTATNTVYYHQNVQGSVIQLTDEIGNIVEQYSYDVFGAVTIKDSNGSIIATSNFGNRFLFTGREFIHETGLYDYRFRMYSPLLGRFLQTDPIRFAAGDVNLYRYVENNAVNKTDPFGLKPPKKPKEPEKKPAPKKAELEIKASKNPDGSGSLETSLKINPEGNIQTELKGQVNDQEEVGGSIGVKIIFR